MHFFSLLLWIVDWWRYLEFGDEIKKKSCRSKLITTITALLVLRGVIIFRNVYLACHSAIFNRFHLNVHVMIIWVRGMVKRWNVVSTKIWPCPTKPNKSKKKSNKIFKIVHFSVIKRNYATHSTKKIYFAYKKCTNFPTEISPANFLLKNPLDGKKTVYK